VYDTNAARDSTKKITKKETNERTFSCCVCGRLLERPRPKGRKDESEGLDECFEWKKAERKKGGCPLQLGLWRISVSMSWIDWTLREGGTAGAAFETESSLERSRGVPVAFMGEGGKGDLGGNCVWICECGGGCGPGNIIIPPGP